VDGYIQYFTNFYEDIFIKTFKKKLQQLMIVFVLMIFGLFSLYGESMLKK